MAICVATTKDRFSVAYGSRPCGRQAKVQDADGWHCGIHSQAARDRVEEKRKQKRDQWDHGRQIQMERDRYSAAAVKACKESGLTVEQLEVEGCELNIMTPHPV